jgi:hypothetical protein
MTIYKVHFNTLIPNIKEYTVISERKTYKVGPKEYIEKKNSYLCRELAEQRVYEYCKQELEHLERALPIFKEWMAAHDKTQN